MSDAYHPIGDQVGTWECGGCFDLFSKDEPKIFDDIYSQGEPFCQSCIERLRGLNWEKLSTIHVQGLKL